MLLYIPSENTKWVNLLHIMIARLFTLWLTQAQCDLGQIMWQMMIMQGCLDPRMSKVLASIHDPADVQRALEDT